MEQHTHQLDEWHECCQMIGRLDVIRSDIRKFGFTLITALITANALLKPQGPVADGVAASGVTVMLILVLFGLDR